MQFEVGVTPLVSRPVNSLTAHDAALSVASKISYPIDLSVSTLDTVNCIKRKSWAPAI
jgi:hypothetical protein